MSAETAIEFKIAHSGQMGNALLGRINRLRSHSPIYWSDAQHLWIVTGHEQVAAAFKSQGATSEIALSVNRMTELFDNLPAADRARLPNFVEYFPNFLINIDPPSHFRLRKIMMKAFTRKVSESYRSTSRAIVAEVIDAALVTERVEFVGDIAVQATGRMILTLMNLPHEHLGQLRRWSTNLVRGVGAGNRDVGLLQEADRVLGEMRDLFGVEVARRRADPGDDFISALILAEDEDGHRLTDAECIATCMISLIAGNDTTSNTMTLIVALLSQRPDLHDQLTARGVLSETDLMELMRYVAMSATQYRVVARDFEWEGHQLKKGQAVYLMIAGANRDDSVFDNPEMLDFDRPQMANMTFAPGVHHCIGHFFAKMQLSEFMNAWLSRVERSTLIDPDLDWDLPVSFRGLRQLNLAVTPRAVAAQ